MCTKQQHPKGRKIEGALDIYRIVQELWNRAEPGFSEAELRWFADSGEYTEAFIGYIADTAENIGCCFLVNGEQWAGSEKHDMCDFLFFLAESMRCAKALAMVGSNASSLLRCGRFAG